MENEATRRRPLSGENNKYPLIYQLVILLRSRKEILYLCTKSSLALRVAAMCDLAIYGAIAKEGNTVRVIKSVGEPILNEIVNKISIVTLDPKKTLKSLNGEIKSSNGIKNFRNKIYKEMERSGLIKNAKTSMYNKIKVQSDESWSSIFNRLASACEADILEIETIVILICLNYVNRMESLLTHCNETLAKSIVNHVEKIKDMIRKKFYPNKHELIFDFLSSLV